MELNLKISQKLIAALLSADPSVDECVVRLRQDSSGAEQAVAYIVPRGQQAFAQLRLRLCALLDRNSVNHACNLIPLKFMPLTAGGEIDEAALESLPLLDDKLACELVEQLCALPGVAEAAAVIDDYVPEFPALHLSTLLADWEQDEFGQPAKADTGKSSHTTTPPIRPGVAAHSVGAELLLNANSPRWLADALESAALHHPAHGLSYVQADASVITQSYAELFADAKNIARGLQRGAISPGSAVIFQLDRAQDFIPAFWGCVLAGCVPVPIAVAHQISMQDTTVQKLAKAWAMLHQPIVLSRDSLCPNLEQLADETEFAGLALLSIETLRKPDTTPACIQRGDADAPAVILLTSGSTGLPKGVVLSQANLLAMALGTAQQNGFNSEDVTLNWMPLEHVGAVSFLQTMAVVLGCQQVHAPTDYVLQNPLLWLDLIEKHRASITWGPNFAFGLLNDLAASIAKRRWDLSSMRFMVSAAEQIVAKTVREFLRLLAAHGLAADSIHPAFGMSETCSGITWSSRFSLQPRSDETPYVELGGPIPGASIRIVDADNRVLDEGEIGRLQLKGPSVTAGYFEAPERNRITFSSDGWFDTGDLGFLYEGRLALTGREKEEIIINGVNYAGAEIEAAVEACAGIVHSYTAAVAVHTAQSSADRLAIFFVAETQDESSLAELLTRLRQQLGSSTGITPSFLIPLTQHRIPKTEIGKIQRKLLRQRFEAGEYQDILRQIDVLSANANTLPDWFMQRRWLPRQNLPAAAEQAGTVLALLDNADQATALSTLLASNCRRLITVVPGPEYSQIKDNLYTVNINKTSSYIKLLEIILSLGSAPEQVLHFWTCAPDAETQALPTDAAGCQRGTLSLLCLLQALAQCREPAAARLALLVFSARAQMVHDAEPLDISKAAIGGLLKTAAREYDWLDVAHIDLAGPDFLDQAECIQREMVGRPLDQEVAWRDGQRLVLRLTRTELPVAKARPEPFVRGGYYLLSGGLGALGVEVARYLLKHYAAGVLLLGRSAELDETRQARLTELQQAGDDVCYRAVDICDRAALERGITQAETAAGKQIDGVIHLAGSFHQCALGAETPKSFRAALAAKMDGGLNLHQLLAQRGAGVFIAFGSVNGFFGGNEFAAYAAANSFLSGFSRWQNQHSAVRSWCLEWSMWDDMGISQGFAAKAASRAQGFYALSAEQGMLAFRIGLQHDQRQLFIGLDASRPNLRPYIMDGSSNSEYLQAYMVAEPALSLAEIQQQLRLTDSFARPLDYRLCKLDAMPKLASGESDSDRLYQLHGQAQLAGESHVAPRNESERRIASIWQDVLGCGEIGIHDNFFGLGGDSLKGARVMNRLQEELGVTLHVVALFNAPTVAELATHLTEHYTQVSGQRSVDKITVADEARLSAMIHPLQARRTSPVTGPRRAIFVLSPPRSGSTLLRVMLGGHPGLFAPPELYLLSFNTLAEWRDTFSGEQTFWSEGLLRALMEIKSIKAEQAEAILQDYAKRGVSTQDFFQQMQSWLGERLLVDKTPTYALDLEVLKRIEADFDEVYYIHLQRHPYGVIRSFDEARLDQLLYAFMPSLHCEGEAPFSRLQLAELIWLICNRNILQFLKQIPAQRQLALRFEDLVSQPEASMQRMCQFLELDYEAAMLQPYENKSARMTDGLHKQSRMLGDLKFHGHKTIDHSVADSWKREYQEDFLGEVTWEIAKQFGYRSLQDEVVQSRAKINNPVEKQLTEEEQLLAKLGELSDEDVERELEKILAGSRRG